MWTWFYLAIKVLFIVYAIWTVIFIIMDEREPSSALAWILFVNIAPVFGIIIYVFLGRRTRSQVASVRYQTERTRRYLQLHLASTLRAQRGVVTRVAATLREPAHARLLRFTANSAYSVLTQHNQAEVLQNGSELFPRLLHDIEMAKHHIHMHYYQWASDELGEVMYKALAAKAHEGVEVRVVYDSWGSLTKLSPFYAADMRKAGVQFHAGISPASARGIFTGINYRNHTKIVVIDGLIGYTGGMNMAQEYVDGGKRFARWRDSQVRLVGESVGILQGIFARSWAQSRGEELSGKYFPTAVVAPSAVLPVQIVYSGPHSQREAIRMTYLEMITVAQKRVFIQSPYFIPDPALIAALCNAALAGVDVRLMITGVPDNKSVLAAGFSYFHTVMQSGVKVYLYQAGFLHAKTMCIDGSVTSIGSANFDIRSFRLDFECNALIYDERLSRRFERDFEADQAECDQFSIAKWKALPFTTRLYMSVARLASPIL